MPVQLVPYHDHAIRTMHVPRSRATRIYRHPSIERERASEVTIDDSRITQATPRDT